MTNGISDKEKDALLVFLQHLRCNQELYMKQQWYVAGLAFALYGIVIHYLKGSKLDVCCVIPCLLLLVAGFSVFIINELNRSIKDTQEMAKNVYSEFTVIRDIVNKYPKRVSHKITSLLICTIIIGGLFSCMLMC